MTRSALRLLSILVLFGTGTLLGQTRVSLDTVLERMEAVGREFRNLEADIERTKVVVIVDDHSTSSGKFYFARSGDTSRIRMTIEKPSRQELLIDKGMLQMYFPRINQVQVADLGENQDKAEFMAIGFGQSSADLLKYYDVTLAGEESIDGIATSILDLKPKSVDFSAIFSNIRLWIDQERWIPLHTKLAEAGGDYLDVRFSNIRINRRLSNSVFELKLPKDVQRIGG